MARSIRGARHAELASRSYAWRQRRATGARSPAKPSCNPAAFSAAWPSTFASRRSSGAHPGIRTHSRGAQTIHWPAHREPHHAVLMESRERNGSYLPTLVVDSNVEAARQLAWQLRHFGFPGDIASNALETAVTLRRRAYGTLVIVTDLDEQVDRAKVSTIRKHAPDAWMIVITSAVRPDALEVVHRCGGDSLLVAPFSTAELAARLSACARRSRVVANDIPFPANDFG
jgi:CheY-like chemotaxis protein